MSFDVKNMLKRVRRPPYVANPESSEAHGPHPDLKPVLGRHPDWRKRLVLILTGAVVIRKKQQYRKRGRG